MITEMMSSTWLENTKEQYALEETQEFTAERLDKRSL